jgi:hypothetical protein
MWRASAEGDDIEGNSIAGDDSESWNEEVTLNHWWIWQCRVVVLVKEEAKSTNEENDGGDTASRGEGDVGRKRE